MIKRREFIKIISGTFAASCGAGRVSHARKLDNRIPRLGVLFAGVPARSPQLNGLWEGLRNLGYMEGQNIYVDLRAAEGRNERLASLAAEFVGSKPDVIVGVTSPAIRALKDVTTSIPIVMAVVSDPVRLGFVDSLARPGGNITGVSNTGDQLLGKRLQLLKEIAPGVRKVGLLWNVTDPQHENLASDFKQAVEYLGLTPAHLPVKGPTDLDRIDGLATDKIDGLIVAAGGLTFGYRKQTVEYTIRNRIAAVFTYREEAADGALLSYGTNLPDVYRRAAFYVDKLLKGTKPAELPVEQPTRFALVLNLKTARALGLEVPPQLLARADEVIE
jgi:putative tryptophan/tyrosine transport system substrate-binding protein